MMIDVQQVLRRGAGVLAAMGLGLICGQALRDNPVREWGSRSCRDTKARGGHCD